MKTALIYTRVSTDEQAEKGFSLADQEQRLTAWCNREGYAIPKKFSDDFTGKTFERPAFKSLLEFLKTNKVDLVVFTKWSRFSRNTTDAYGMIRTLKDKFNVTVQSIDQPIDFSIPQNKYLLAFYLAEPEIDNDVRSDNTLRGMRRAMKEGRCVYKAPQGYLNKRDENNRPILVIDPIKAPLVREMFSLMATGLYPQQHVRKMMFAKGLKFRRSNFRLALENFMYIGKIKIRSYKGEPEELANGVHPPLIDEQTFYRVQQIISQKKIRRPSKLNEDLPLRGFLYCNESDHRMTGSCSHGHGGKYFYYHCHNNTCQRHKAPDANQAYFNFLKSIKIEEEAIIILRHTLEYYYKPDPSKTGSLQHQINQQQQRIQILHDKYIDGHISAEDYKQIKARYETNLFELKNQLKEITLAQSEFQSNFNDSMNLLANLPELYMRANIENKREIIGSITPGKLYFENNKCRTSKINDFIRLISTISNNNTLQKVYLKDPCPVRLPLQDTSSNLFIEGAQKLANVLKLVA